MTEKTPPPASESSRDDDDRAQIEAFCRRFHGALRIGAPAPFEDLLAEAQPHLRDALLAKLISEDAQIRAQGGEKPAWEDYAERFADRQSAARKGFRDFDPGTTLLPEFDTGNHSLSDTEEKVFSSRAGAVGDSGEEDNEEAQDDPMPTCLGEYKVVKLLGKGTFGYVYQANHPLRGDVAIKVLKQKWAADQKYLELFAKEGQWMADADHPHLVKVLDLQCEHDPPFFVQQFMSGGDLLAFARRSNLDADTAAEITAQIADALAAIHRLEIYHRDLKPANVLMDHNGKAHVADFGLALPASQRWRHRGNTAGTLKFMPREQLQGETPLLTARSDLWSLGVIFYWLLTREYPFEVGTKEASARTQQQELVDEIVNRTPKAPREIDETIPAAYQQLCMHCLMKEIHLRPPSAADFRDALRKAIAQQKSNRSSSALARSQLSVVFPKPSLTRFTATQSDVYLSLMPSSFANQDELPETIAFWKRRASATDADQSFRVGVLVGVSGCGKSSLLEAGLVPRLDSHVRSILVQATERGTEAQVLKELHNAFPRLKEIARGWSLNEWIVNLRDSDLLDEGEKVLIIVDQFEQWLHAHGGQRMTQLEAALRQCDGARVQTLICVREGFHSSLMKFIQALEIVPDGDINYATAHRFTKSHAKYVLEQYGRGQGNLKGDLTETQQAFLQAAVDVLDQADRGVVCVQLVVLALVMEDRPWTMSELDKLDGMQGIGRQFLHDQFEGRRSSELLRSNEAAATRILESLLPAEGLEIKHSQSYDTLLKESGLTKVEFDPLLNDLVRKLFLVTPVDEDEAPTVGREQTDPQIETNPEARRAYQLTHDFLVPAVRQWIQWKEEQTPEGRAQLKLRQLARAWQADENKRHLPSLQEYFQIRRRTDCSRWTKTQAALMKTAGRFYGWRSLGFIATMLMLSLLTYAGYCEAQAGKLVSSLLNADVSRVAEFRRELGPFSWRADSKLAGYLQTETDPLRLLHARIGLVVRDPNQIEPLQDALLDELLPIEYLKVIGDALEDAKPGFAGALWEVLRDATRSDGVRFRAGLALSFYEPKGANDEESKWTDADGDYLVRQYLAANPESLGVIREYLRPNAALLNSPLGIAFSDPKLSDVQQEAAAKAWAAFFPVEAKRGDFDNLLPLLLSGTAKQYQILFPLVRESNMLDQDLLKLVREPPPMELSSVNRVEYGKQRATAAITLLRKEWARRDILRVLKVTDDPEAMTQFIHRSKARGVTVAELLELWDLPEIPKLLQRHALPVKDRKSLDSQLFGLLLSLGEYTWSQVPNERQTTLREQVADLYRDDKSSGIHAAAGWLLRHWGKDDAALWQLASDLERQSAEVREGWEWHRVKLDVVADGKPQTYYQTYVLFEPGEFQFGSHADELARAQEEVPHRRAMAGFWMLDRELTRGEVESTGLLIHSGYEGKSKTLNHAMVSPNWYDAVRFSNWLSGKLGYADSRAYAAHSDLPESDYERDKADGGGRGIYNWPVDLTARGFRLPTEHEWEAGCRGGLRTAFNFGSDPALLRHYCWYAENSGEQVHLPRELRPSLRGLFDMHGNAIEWCHDWGAANYGATLPASGPEKGTLRVVRGGYWASPQKYCRSAYRSRETPSYRMTSFGIRVLRSYVGESRGSGSD